jgi:hypothetical protein
LNKIINRVSSLSKINGIGNDVLLQELKYTVLLKHFENNKPSQFDLMSYAFVGDWCGKNTDILYNLKKETDYDSINMNSMQRICRMHDLRYSKSTSKDDIYKADVEMLKSIADIFFIKGIKSNIDEPFTNFVDYISNQLTNIFTTGILNPVNIAGTLVNFGFTNKLFENVKNFREQSYLKNTVDLAINADRIVSILGFGAIGLKVLYDASLGKYLDNVYGYEETRFKPDEIKEILVDFEKNINQRLEQTGYDTIDMFKIIELPEQEFEKVIEEPKEEIVEDTIKRNDIEQDIENVEEDAVINDNILNNTRNSTEDEIDITEGEFNTIEDLINLLK